jgi:carbamoyltransferase
MDGSGDFVSSTVSIWRNNSLERVASTRDADSLGLIWSQITQLLGMKPVEHEYKVMGLAPYAPVEGTEKALQRIRPLVTLNDDLTFRTSFATMWEVNHFESSGLLQGLRFDHIAAGLQKMTEDLLTRWVANAIEKYGMRTVVFGGGVFMNVKANMKIAQMSQVDKAFFMPSCGDESLAIGASQYGHYLISGQAPKPLEDLYLGPAYPAGKIEEELEFGHESLRWERYNDIDIVVSELLAKGEIVARFDERMEWGARALGNRSILADPNDWDVVKKINIAIKQRDFWMPFAPTILAERAIDYVSSPSPSKVNGEYMIVAFESTEKVPGTMKAAMHPYDLTIRPQLLRKEHNPRYYRLIERFSELRGKSGILNTSFNLHGEPVVCSPKDALSTFRRSGLDYLAIGNYLVTKKSSE